MSTPTLAAYRRATLAEVQGAVLEIGFGTGLNLSYYPPHLRQLVAIDANPGVHALAQKRLNASPIQVDYQVLNGEALPFTDGRFDSVVTTWTLCSIARVEQAIAEIHRVLKPGGRFFFVEHGLSQEPSIQVWQNRLTPVQRVIADGCHLNRNMRSLIERHFESVTLTEFYASDLPKVLGYLYQGSAYKRPD